MNLTIQTKVKSKSLWPTAAIVYQNALRPDGEFPAIFANLGACEA